MPTIDPIHIIEQHYTPHTEVYDILLTHSKEVTTLALDIASRRPELNIDKTFVYEAAMLHDLGIIYTHAPSIHCFGDEPYIKHGIIGADILRGLNLPKHANVAERHTSSGLTPEEIEKEKLPLPLDRSYLPETICEKLICYADCFYSKTKLHRKKSAAAIFEKMEKQWQQFGLVGPAQNAIRFKELHDLFEPEQPL